MPLPKLKIPKEEVTQILKERIAKGRQIKESGTSLFGSLDDARREERLWNDYNKAFVERTFGDRTAEEYDQCVPKVNLEVSIFSSKGGDRIHSPNGF
jgi:hypothetical protein